ncbi:MAG TPA: DUF4157 domain-containing protein [Rhizomicrobium sp.]|jgi:hypothetical protein
MFADRVPRRGSDAPRANAALRGSRQAAEVLPSAKDLAGSGRPLPQAVRAPAEAAFGQNFSQVRVHEDAAAQRSAESLGARGWSWGEHVVLGKTSGADTLAHELAHVAQQREAPREASLQLGERHGALEDDAHAAVRGGHPPSLKAESRAVQMQSGEEKGRPPSLQLPQLQAPPRLQMPQHNFGYQPPKLDTGIVPAYAFHLTASDRLTIDSYLSAHDFKLMQLKPSLDGAAVTVDEIVNRLRPQIALTDRVEIERYVTGKVQGLVNDALLHPRITAGPAVPTQLSLPLMSSRPPGKRTAGAPPEKIQGWQTVLAAGAQIAWHIDVATGKPSSTPQDVTMQFQAARNFAGHAENQSGSELQGIVQFGYNITTGQVTVLSGAQYTEVFSLFQGHLQLAGFAQLLAGIAAGGGSVSAQIQPSVGAQALVQIGPVQVGPQVSRGITATQGSPTTQDTAVGGTLQVSF